MHKTHLESCRDLEDIYQMFQQGNDRFPGLMVRFGSLHPGYSETRGGWEEASAVRGNRMYRLTDHMKLHLFERVRSLHTTFVSHNYHVINHFKHKAP